nr:MAG TPA: hypothetical protein [Caudoviricetes sp.]
MTIQNYSLVKSSLFYQFTYRGILLCLILPT